MHASAMSINRKCNLTKFQKYGFHVYIRRFIYVDSGLFGRFVIDLGGFSNTQDYEDGKSAKQRIHTIWSYIRIAGSIEKVNVKSTISTIYPD